MRKTYVIVFIFAVLLAACVRPAPANTPAPTTAAPEEPQGVPYPVVTLTPPPTNTPLPTSPPDQPTTAPPAGQTAVPTEALPTTGPVATATEGAAATATTAPTQTPAASPTATLPPFDPSAGFGPPDFRDSMKAFSEINWEGQSGTLPDDKNIKLALVDDALRVTGKKLFFDTWWFSWPVLEDFFIEMDVTTGACSGRDAYGMILRGPLRGTGNTWGYIVSFSCDGSLLLRRVDDADPYTVVDLIPWTANVNIKTGSEKTNTLGIEANGDTLTIYANNFQIAKIVDTKYGEGRYGVFVSPAQTSNFTYDVEEIRYWDLDN